MAANEIQSRIAEELQRIAPFDRLDTNWLFEMAKRARVNYYEHGVEIFKAGDESTDFYYLLMQGKVELFEQQDQGSQLVDLCTEGECFGLRSLITKQSYSLTARVRDEALVYAIPTSLMRDIMQKEGNIALHFANMLALRQKNEPSTVDFSEENSSQIAEIGNLPEWVKPSTSLISCSKVTSISEAATLMKEAHVSSIIILNEEEHPVGIVTQTDLAHHVATGLIGTTAKVDKLMNSPVKTAKLPLSDEEAALIMLSKGIKHLVITEDGTSDSPAIGIVSDRDIQLRQRFSARYILHKIHKAETINELANLREQCSKLAEQQLDAKVPVTFILRTIHFLHQEITASIIKKRLTKVHSDHWCWVNMGSMGRGEQLFPTDQDNAIICSNELSETSRNELLNLAREVNADLMECGFEYCPANMMAGNEEWCLSIGQWEEKFKTWIKVPTPKSVMYSTIFFDMSTIFGNHTLLESLQSSIKKNIQSFPAFLTFLAKDALKNPAPISFLNNLIVEQDGAHKDSFDIKARAIMPLVDAARVLALSKEMLQPINTQDRFFEAITHWPEQKELLQTASKAHQRLLTYRYRQARKFNDNGRFIKPKSLDSFDRQLLKQCFGPLKDIQNFIRRNFDTDLIPS